MNKTTLFTTLVALIPAGTAGAADVYMEPGRLAEKLSKICPVSSVQFGNTGDKSTWKITYDPACTPAQIAKANAVVDAIDPSEIPVPERTLAIWLRTALAKDGLLVRVEEWVAKQDGATQKQWREATTFERNNGVMSNAAMALGISSDKMDFLFREAAKTLRRRHDARRPDEPKEDK